MLGYPVCFASRVYTFHSLVQMNEIKYGPTASLATTESESVGFQSQTTIKSLCSSSDKCLKST